MDGKKFLGVCILLAAIILAVAVVWHAKATAKATSQVGRYQFLMHEDPAVMWIIDTTTGEVTAQH